MIQLCVADIMTPDPTALAPDDTVAQVRAEMALGEIRHIPVVDVGGLVGVVSQRDLIAFRGNDDAPIYELMHADVVTVDPTTAAHEAAYLLLRHRIGCLPVVDARGYLHGIVTDTDFVRAAYTLLGGRVPVDELLAEEREADNL